MQLLADVTTSHSSEAEYSAEISGRVPMCLLEDVTSDSGDVTSGSGVVEQLEVSFVPVHFRSRCVGRCSSGVFLILPVAAFLGILANTGHLRNLWGQSSRNLVLARPSRLQLETLVLASDLADPRPRPIGCDNSFGGNYSETSAGRQIGIVQQGCHGHVAASDSELVRCTMREMSIHIPAWSVVGVLSHSTLNFSNGAVYSRLRDNGWYDGGEDRSCEEGCAALGLVCSEAELAARNSEVDTSSKLLALIQGVGGLFYGSICNADFGNAPDVPSWKRTMCFGSAPARPFGSFSCGARPSPLGSGKHRLCYCHAKLSRRSSQKGARQSALQHAQRQSMRSPVQKNASPDKNRSTDCRAAQQGEQCHAAVVEVLKKLRRHETSLRGLDHFSTFEDVQRHLHATEPESGCLAPCPCHSAVTGEKCYEAVSWVLDTGISKHPEWYRGLGRDSGREEVQAVLHRQESRSNCSWPCQPAVVVASLFCFSVMRTTGYEPGLVKSQVQRKASIFACEGFQVFSSDGGSAELGDGPRGPVIATQIPRVDDGTGSWGSWLNTRTFMNAWDVILSEGRFAEYDWVVKVDPDAVFLPSRLRALLLPHTGPQKPASYVENCDQPPHIAMQGSLEVFSYKAVQLYGDQKVRCMALPWQGWGEDLYMQKCMETLGVQAVQKFDIMSDVNCVELPCSDTSRVSFHPYKDADSYWDCWGVTRSSVVQSWTASQGSLTR
mmetsp:Transcript_56609/g.131975  ORF Transcript_56609/g.131975 Transcript_56609/m.131975 type:complete len:721 (-) Transcript_56609:215-2377(-)